jgi:AMIN domain-containing protein
MAVNLPMQNVRQIGLSALVSAGLCFTAAGQTPSTQVAPSFAHQPPVAPASMPRTSTAPQSALSVKRVQVLGGKDAVEIEVEGSDRLTPQTKVLTNPDRLVIDFPNAAPSAQVRNQTVNRGEVKDVRVGLFQSNPPVTRVVLDLKSAQSFQIFPDRKTLIIKVSGKVEKTIQGVDDFPETPATRPGLLTTTYAEGAGNIRAAAAEPVLDVTFRNGMLSIKSSKSSLSEILFAVHQRTGADVTLSAGAEQEKVAADLGPAPAPQVLARLLNGSKFNYLILSSADDSSVLDKVILSPKAVGAVAPLPPMPAEDMEDTPAPPPVTPQQRATEPPSENQPAVTNAPPTNGPPTNAPPTNTPPGVSAFPHNQQPPPGTQPASTPPPDDSNPE